MSKDVLRNVGYVLLASALAVFLALEGDWKLPVAAAALAVGGGLIVWPHLFTRDREPPLRPQAINQNGVPLQNQDPRAAAQAQLEDFRRRRSELEQVARGADGLITVLDLSGSPPTKPIEVADQGQVYRLKFSRSGGTNVWVYGDDPSIRSIAVDRHARRCELVDVTTLRPERDTTFVNINERVFATTTDGRVIQVLVLSVRDYNAGDDRDEVRLCYKIYPAGEFLTPAL